MLTGKREMKKSPVGAGLFVALHRPPYVTQGVAVERLGLLFTWLPILRSRWVEMQVAGARRVFVRIGYSSNPSECCPSSQGAIDRTSSGQGGHPAITTEGRAISDAAWSGEYQGLGQLTTGCRGAGCSKKIEGMNY